MRLITQIWSAELGRYIEDELTLLEAMPSFQREALERLADAFPGSEWVDVPAEAQEGPQDTQAVA